MLVFVPELHDLAARADSISIAVMRFDVVWIDHEEAFSETITYEETRWNASPNLRKLLICGYQHTRIGLLLQLAMQIVTIFTADDCKLMCHGDCICGQDCTLTIERIVILLEVLDQVQLFSLRVVDLHIMLAINLVVRHDFDSRNSFDLDGRRFDESEAGLHL
ncbi:hypothetical protein D3C76_859230 [compost metagenome]